MVRHQLATVHELARLDVFQGLSGEALGRLAARLWRIDLEPGETLEIDADVEVVLVLSGMLTGRGGVLDEGAILPGAEARHSPPRSIARSRLVACDRDAYEELLAPLLAGGS